MKDFLDYRFVEFAQLWPGPFSVGQLAFEDEDKGAGFDKDVRLTISMPVRVVELKPLVEQNPLRC